MNSHLQPETLARKAGLPAALPASVFLSAGMLVVPASARADSAASAAQHETATRDDYFHTGAGKSPDEIVAAKPTAAFDAEWGNFVFNGEQFTRMAYAGLQ